MKTNLSEKKNRIWEIDFLRGIAFVCMVYDHTVYDINFIFGIKTNFFWGYGGIIGDFSAVTFMILCGISSTLSKNNLKRGIGVLASALALSAGTALADNIFHTRLVIVFGIMHFLGTAMIVSHFAKRFSISITCISAFLSFFLGKYFETIRSNTDVLCMFGIHSAHFYSSDYYPVFPNIAFVLTGIILGKVLYKEKKSLFPFKVGRNPLSFFGRHSFILYYVHQPIVFIILFIVIKLLNLT